ncbi:MAG: EF-P 5-aminopentanol modification-associated protein YfmF [Bacilli bacterium]
MAIGYEITQRALNGMNVHYLKTTKFKTVAFVIKLRSTLQREEATNRGLVPYVLQSGTKKWPTSTQFRAHLEDLYGGTFYVDVERRGTEQVISIYLEVANQMYLPSAENVNEQALSTLHELLFQPLLENGAFSKTIVTREKENLKDRITSIYDDKMRYASVRLMNEMCKNETIGIHPYGQIEDVDSITPESLYEAYEQMMKTDCVDVYCVGNIDTVDIEPLLERYLPFEKNGRITERTVPDVIKVPEKVEQVFESQPITQGKLNMGYRMPITYASPNYFALLVFNGIFGGFSHSKLFIEVREKNSLCYYVGSRYDSHSGLMFVMSGISADNYDKTTSIIGEQLQAMRNGQFDESDIQQTKTVMKNQVLETLDSIRGTIEMMYHNAISTVDYSVEEWMEHIENVKHEDIVEVARCIQLDTVYFLSNRKEEE